jgi:hypothetical protein
MVSKISIKEEITPFIFLQPEQMTAKTSVIYRPFLLSEVKQDIDTMLYNATDMVSAYTKKTGKRKDITDFMRQKETSEYVNLLENLNTGNPVFTMKRGKY